MAAHTPAGRAARLPKTPSVTIVLKRLLLVFVLAFSLAASAVAQDMQAMLDQVEGLEALIRFSRPSPNATVRYPNGQVATNLYGSATATWRWPNGQTLSMVAASPTGTWFWPNGKVMTNQIGSKTATWYWPDGQVMMLTGGGFSEAELQDVPALAARVLRMAKRRGF